MQEQNNPMANLQQQVANLKSQFAGQDPNDIIQQMLNSGKVSQEQYNSAVQKYNQLQQMFGK
jgi:hypothetical protein